MTPEEVQALRFCARTTWQQRDRLGLSEAQRDEALIAWIAIGEPPEAEAAAGLLASREKTARQQATFDQLLSHD